eukprot:TRINITY_DN11602_c0_g1_i1.p1 TRINITY_DN11602_c0_g1~~TRINITY_DN11602_c0_g1_i1.p1  ORF type:complete len:649 (-),score=88.15 TRINITY_DN11602_c0_g1_i1:275-2179(-)
MTSHSNDCVTCDFRMVYVPARDHAPGTNRTIFSAYWDQYPRLVDPSRSDQYTAAAGITSSEVLGSISQVTHTYALWEASYGLMNERGLGMGESTCPAFLVGKGVEQGGDALFTIGNLMAIALERCETARCAVQTMGDLGSRYGFYGEDPGVGGGGEAVTLVDKAGDAWVFHICGGVHSKGVDVDPWVNQRGALWVAQRVPTGHVAVVANSFVIQEVDVTDTDNFMLHPGLLALTQEAGLWDGKGRFNFQRTMAPNMASFSYFPGMAPIPMYSTLRMWGVFQSVAPSRGLKPSKHMEDFPFSVSVDHRLSHLDVMNLFRSHYEGTEFDMRLGALAGPWQSPNRAEGGVGQQTVPGQFARGTSIQRTSYTVILQSGIPQPVTWFAPDAPASSVFVPFFSDVLATGGGRFDVETFGKGSSKSFSFGLGGGGQLQPAWWAFDFVANWLELSYQNMSESYVHPAVRKLQAEVDGEARFAVAAFAGDSSPDAGKVLGEAQAHLHRRVTEQWWKLAEMLVVRYNDGFFNFADDKQSTVEKIGYPAFWLEMVGFNQEAYRPTWMKPTLLPPRDLPRNERLLALKAVESHEAASEAIIAIPVSNLIVALLGIAVLFGFIGAYVGVRWAAPQPSRQRDDYNRLS